MRNFFTAYILLLALCMTSCWLPPMLMPADIDTPVPIDQDTLPVVDTIPIVDTCINPVMITDPPFVTGYMEITDQVQTDVQLIVGTHSIWITGYTAIQIETTLDSMLELWKPQYEYTVYVNDQDTRLMAIIIDGTNDRVQFYLGAQLRYNGLKHYLGWNTQAFTFSGALTQDEYAAVVDKYPSVDIVNWRLTQYDSTFYISSAYKILGECKEGRWYANFSFNPYPILDTIPILFQAAGWESVLHAQDPDGTTDLRAYQMSKAVLIQIAATGHQIITKA